jgi:phosphoribosylpyrophosphate synthetase
LGLRRLIVTDTLPAADLPGIPLGAVSVAPLLADAIARLHDGRSLGDLLAHDPTP